MESCDIYIKGVKYQDSSWLSNPDVLLSLVYVNLSEISSFYFVSLALNMAQVYNVSLKQSNYDSMVLYIKGVKYKREEFLKLKELQRLIRDIKEQLTYIDGLSFGSIEVRCAKTYFDRELGVKK